MYLSVCYLETSIINGLVLFVSQFYHPRKKMSGKKCDQDELCDGKEELGDLHDHHPV